MNPMNRIPVALAGLALAVMGCAQPSGAPNSAGGATTQPSTTAPSVGPSATATAQQEAAVPEPPVEFTGVLSCGPPVRDGSEQSLDVGDEGMVLTRYRGSAWRQSVTMSDPRLEGIVHHTFEGDDYAMPAADSGPGFWAATRRIENDDGAWEDQGYGGNFSDGTPIGGESTGEVWVGQGGYEGMIAIMEGTPVEGTDCDVAVRGIIFDGVPPLAPYIAP